MLRKLLTVVLPLALPTLLYIGYLLIERRRSRRAARHIPWVWLVLAGVGLMGATLAGMTLLDGGTVGGVYHPPAVVDGQVVPGRIVPPGPDRP